MTVYIRYTLILIYPCMILTKTTLDFVALNSYMELGLIEMGLHVIVLLSTLS